MRLCLLMFALLTVTPAWAEPSAPSVLLWGFQRGAESVSDLDRYVQRELASSGFPGVELLQPGVSTRTCQAAAAGAVVRRNCSKLPANVRVLGGRLDSLRAPANRARLWLYDASTGKTAWLDTYCQSCMQANLLARNAVALLNNPDFGTTPGAAPSYCAQATSAEGAAAQPPADACAPWPERSCDAASLVGSGASPTPVGIDPKLARILKGLTWGAFAASAATTIGLAAANPFVMRDVDGRRYDNTLAGPAVTLAGVSVGLLAIAIPSTLLINRAERSTSNAAPAEPTANSNLQCPN